jgi:hypothetical protein
MSTEREIIDLERRFWQSVKDMDFDAATALLDEASVSVNAHGIRHFTPARYKAMALSGDARITSFEFFDEQVVFPTPDVAIVTYGARQSFAMAGATHEMVVYDLTTWVRKGGAWVASAHTETPAQAEPPTP